jgi:pimeloyl-ACP methyl ester carboxylesterase
VRSVCDAGIAAAAVGTSPQPRSSSSRIPAPVPRSPGGTGAGLRETRGPDAIAEVFLHDVDPGVARDNERYQGTPGEGMFGEPWPLERWPELPTRVLAPVGDRLFPLEFQRRIARERLGLEIDEIPGGHLPMLSRPHELAERLIELARRG